MKKLYSEFKPLIIAILLLSFLFSDIFNNVVIGQPAPIKIGVSKAAPNYIKWLQRVDGTIATIDLFNLPIESAVTALGTCDGLLLTGGEDVYPGWYGKEPDTIRCTEMDRHRDSLDMKLIAKALELKMPVLGICRGHQILNVFLGGTLIVDIPSDVPAHITHQCEDYLRCHHMVTVEKGNLLSKICITDSALVTTNHHQSVDRIAPVLVRNAFSGDHVVEGFEWKEPEGKSFLLGVQWHPERMEKNNPLSGRLAETFIEKSSEFHQGQSNRRSK